MQQLTIRMPEKFIIKIEQIAKASGLKKSDITRMAIRKFLEEYSGDENTDLFSKAKRLVGVVESGISDLGQNHRGVDMGPSAVRYANLAKSLRKCHDPGTLIIVRCHFITKSYKRCGKYCIACQVYQ